MSMVWRPSYTGRPREALHVTLTPNGNFDIGNGRLSIRRGPVPFVGSVVADLGQILDLPEGAAMLDRADALGQATTIALPEPPTVPTNGWTMPDDLQAATEVGAPCGPRGRDDTHRLGTGKGCGSTVFYNPADWLTPGEPYAAASSEILMALLQQANLNAAGRNRFAEAPADLAAASAATPEAPHFHCSATRVQNTLLFSYIIHNLGQRDIYLMDSWPAPTPRQAPGYDRANVISDPNGDAIVGRFVAPWPLDRQIARVAVPLGRRLAAGATLEGCIEVPEPLTEASPYLPDMPLSQYSSAAIGGVEVRIGYWSADMQDLRAEPASTGSDVFVMAPSFAAARARYVSQRFPTRGLRLLKQAAAAAIADRA